MSRSITINLPPEKRESLTASLESMDGIVSATVLPGASLKPPGDVVIVSTTNEGMPRVLGLLDRLGCGDDTAVETSEPRSLVSSASGRQLDDEGNDGSWPEIAALLRRDTNVTSNFLLSMFFAGLVAATGLLTDMLHIVIGAMVLAPGFEPLIRIPFGLLGKERRAWQQGLSATVLGYGALLLGAVAGWHLVGLVSPGMQELDVRPWVQYWSTVSATAPLLAIAAGATGAVILSAQRSVLTTGVMITLALIPSMAVTGMALAALDMGLAMRGLARWGVDAACLILSGALVFAVKRWRTGRAKTPGQVDTAN